MFASPELLGLAIAFAMGVLTLIHVYRGGTTLNDHAVAAVVVGCHAVYPMLWMGGLRQGLPPAILGPPLAAGALGIYGLFFVLDRRREAGGWMWLAYLSQPAFSFSLWTGLLVVLWAPGHLIWHWPERGLDLWSICWPGLLLLLPLALTAVGTAWTYLHHNNVRVEPLGVPLRIVHLSDLHASPVMPGADLRRVIAAANALEPDLVCITGDLLMPFSEARHGYLLEALAELKAPAIACPGNHDLPVLDTLVDELAALGVPLLVDAVHTFELRGLSVEVVGVGFHWTDAFARFERALARLSGAGVGQAGAADLRVLLAHDPRLFRAVPDGRFDLVLSGHTHGGQVGTDVFGLPWSVLRLFGAYDQGTFWRGRTMLNVSRGNWHTGLPPRMGVSGEIVLLSGRASGAVQAPMP